MQWKDIPLEATWLESIMHKNHNSGYNSGSKKQRGTWSAAFEVFFVRIKKQKPNKDSTAQFSGQHIQNEREFVWWAPQD